MSLNLAKLFKKPQQLNVFAPTGNIAYIVVSKITSKKVYGIPIVERREEAECMVDYVKNMGANNLGIAEVVECEMVKV